MLSIELFSPAVMLKRSLNILPTYLPKICTVSPAFTFNTVAGRGAIPEVATPKL